MTAGGTSSPIALLDANVLYPAPLRDFLLWQAANDVFVARWTDAIHDEWIESLLADRPDLSREQLERTRRLMDSHVDGVPVIGYEHRIDDLHLPDPDDRHVLAAAIECGAAYIVTRNLTDFPEASLSPHGIEAVDPDEFALLLFGRSPRRVVAAAREHWQNLRHPRRTRDEYLANLARVGLPKTSRVLSRPL